MTDFRLPFTIDYPDSKDFILAKCYEEKRECYKLTIPKGKHLEAAVYIKFKGAADALDLSLGIELEEGASVTIIENWNGDIKSPTIRFAGHIHCKAGSDLRYIVLGGSSSQSEITETRTTEVAENAKCHIYTYHFGSKKINSTLRQTATGRNACIDTDIIARSYETREMSFMCKHDFAEKQGSGEIIMKGIAQDKALLNFDGMINIRRTGGGSTGYLKQETLNLSPHTTVRAVPGLKIDTNDVKAGHSAAIRNLSEEDIYYFGARGIAKEMAKKLLITGFLGKELRMLEAYKTAYETIGKLI